MGGEVCNRCLGNFYASSRCPVWLPGLWRAESLQQRCIPGLKRSSAVSLKLRHLSQLEKVVCLDVHVTSPAPAFFQQVV